MNCWARSRLFSFETLTVAEFAAQFGQEKPYYEFWYGEAVQESTSTWVHGLGDPYGGAPRVAVLREASYKPASEVRLKIEAAFHPVPDVIATKGHVEIPCPPKPVKTVVEILFGDDRGHGC